MPDLQILIDSVGVREYWIKFLEFMAIFLVISGFRHAGSSLLHYPLFAFKSLTYLHKN